VVDGMLEIRSESAMLGYLNAPSPFTRDGWYRTGDAVEVDGDFVRIVGRASEVINVGGENVYPVEVESIVQEMDEVAEATVSARDHPITGQVVHVRVRWIGDESARERRARIKSWCHRRMNACEVPVIIEFEPNDGDVSPFKKTRGS